MKRNGFKLIVMALSAALLFSGCSDGSGTGKSENPQPAPENFSQQTEAQPIVLPAAAQVNADAEDSLAEWDDAGATHILLLETGGEVDGSNAAIQDGTVLISYPGVYVLSGTFTGRITVDSQGEGTVRLVLKGVSVSSPDYAPLCVEKADKVILTLAQSTQNIFTDASQYALAQDEDEPSAAVFSRDDLVINGTGSLVVNANYNNGIQGKDDVRLMGGEITVNAADDAIVGKDILYVADGEYILNAGGDGLKSTNDDGEHGSILVEDGDFSITAGAKGMNAYYTLTLNGGKVDITNCYEGLEGAFVTVAGGEVNIVAQDDGINAASGKGSEDEFGDMPNSGDTNYGIIISGGVLRIEAEGDGLDSNGYLAISGGETYISGPTNDGNGSLDYTTTCEITGGTLLAAGSAGMAQVPQSAGQPVAVVYASGSAGDAISVSGEEGDVLSFTPTKGFSCIILTSAALEEGAAYSVSVAGVDQGSFTATAAATQTLGTAPAGGRHGMGPGGMGPQGRGTPGDMPKDERGTPGDMPKGDMPEPPGGGEFPGQPEASA